MVILWSWQSFMNFDYFMKWAEFYEFWLSYEVGRISWILIILWSWQNFMNYGYFFKLAEFHEFWWISWILVILWNWQNFMNFGYFMKLAEFHEFWLFYVVVKISWIFVIFWRWQNFMNLHYLLKLAKFDFWLYLKKMVVWGFRFICIFPDAYFSVHGFARLWMRDGWYSAEKDLFLS